jgi:hypothetical protein
MKTWNNTFDNRSATRTLTGVIAALALGLATSLSAANP